MIKIVDYGSGNTRAIHNVYKQLNIECSFAKAPRDLAQATKLILPGVGAFDEAMSQLVDSGLREALDELVLLKKTPILGICVGMQIMGNKSEEGNLPGLGWIKGKVKKIDTTQLSHKPHVPHLGWNSISPVVSSSLLDDIDCTYGFYFLHTYYFSCDNDKDTLTQTEYGKSFASAVFHDNVYGVQFHPEKSHQNGIQLFKNFANL